MLGDFSTQEFPSQKIIDVQMCKKERMLANDLLVGCWCFFLGGGPPGDDSVPPKKKNKAGFGKVIFDFPGVESSRVLVSETSWQLHLASTTWRIIPGRT